MATVDFATGFEKRATAHLQEGFGRNSTIGSMGPGTIVTTGQRSGARAWRATDAFGSNWFRHFLPNRATRVAACAFKPGAISSHAILGLADASDFSSVGPSGQLSVWLNNNGTFSVYRGSSGTWWGNAVTLLGTTTNAIVTALAYHHMEIRATIDNAGSFDLYIDLDPTPWLSLSGIDTQATANAWANCVGISNVDDGYVDDLYTADSRLSFPDQKLLPWGLDGSVGALNQSTPVGSATRAQNVDDDTANDDTDYNAFDAGETDSYPSDVLNSTGTIRYFIMWQRWKKTDYGPVGTQAGLRIGGVNYLSAAARYLGSLQYENVMAYDANLSPATGLAFTEAELNGAEAVAARVA